MQAHKDRLLAQRGDLSEEGEDKLRTAAGTIDAVRVINEAAAKSTLTFEEKCKEIDDCLSHWRYNLVCRCCAGHFRDGKQCDACKYAVGFHRCGHADRDTDTLLWRKSSLFGGPLDVQRVLYLSLIHI